MGLAREVPYVEQASSLFRIEQSQSANKWAKD